MSIIDDLLTFSRTRPSWQQDLIRRVVTQAEIGEHDLQEVVANLKAENDLGGSSSAVPLGPEHMAEGRSAAVPVTRLLALSSVENANQLACGQELRLAPSGITVVFGYNGSGKTGYARICKQVCRTRHDSPEPVLGNVYGSATVLPPKANIAYSVGSGEEQEYQWESGKVGPAELSRISVFDASVAPLYADQQNRIEFLPAGLDVLPRLGAVCELIGKKLETEVNSVSSLVNLPVSGYRSQHYVQPFERLAAGIAASQLPKVAELESLAEWKESHGLALKECERKLREAAEPAQKAAQRRRFAQTVRSLKAKLDGAYTELANSGLDRAKQQIRTLNECKKAARLATEGRFASEPLPTATGSPAWRRLYEAAEAFNVEAYPDNPFPATGPDRLCLLCQQPLTKAAGERLQRFKAFVEDTTQTQLKSEEARIRAVRQKLASLAIPSKADTEISLAEVITELGATPEVSGLPQLCSQLDVRRKEVLAALDELNENWARAALAEYPEAELRDWAASQDEQAQHLDELVEDTAELAKLKQSHEELLDRKKCSEELSALLLRRDRLIAILQLRKCKTQCDTTQISRKASALRDSYLSQDFANAVHEEAALLGLDYLPIQVEGHTDRGKSFMGVNLKKTRNARTSHVLSEGEFRGLALACFFAELRTMPSMSGIIVDDPVSSLDHLHAREVARRLVAEARLKPEAQVVVFTHDISFYYELSCEAAAEGVPLARIWIDHVQGKGFGVVAPDDSPWAMKTVRDRLAWLEKLLVQIPDPAACGKDAYEQAVTGFYTRLRESWERLVEERLFNKVVGRFQPGVQTLSLKGACVTDADYAKVFFGMKKASERSGHDRPAGRQPDVPTKMQMKADLDELRAYEGELKKRISELESQRRELENPPRAKAETAVGRS
jgi:energy-coupling factor transporter ATP-binding protein EcfA2